MPKCVKRKYEYRLDKVEEIAERQPSVVFFDNFKCGFCASGATAVRTQCRRQKRCDYEYYTQNLNGTSLVANDASGGVNVTQNSLEIKSTPFTTYYANSLDHYKWLALQKKTWGTPKRGEIVFETVASAQQVFPNGITGVTGGVTGTTLGVPTEYLATSLGGVTGVNNANMDLRLGAGVLTAMDPINGMVYSFYLTNEQVYAGYDRLPFGKPSFSGSGADYHAFNHVIPLVKRNVSDPLNDNIKLSININYYKNYVRWLVNDQELLLINRLGYALDRKYRIIDYGGPDTLARDCQLRFGFGTQTLLDAYNPYNPGSLNNIALLRLNPSGYYNPVVTGPMGDPLVSSFLSTASTSPTFRDWGQGVILRLRYVAIYVLPDPSEFVCLKSQECSYPTLVAISRGKFNRYNGVNSDDCFLIAKGEECKKKSKSSSSSSCSSSSSSSSCKSSSSSSEECSSSSKTEGSWKTCEESSSSSSSSCEPCKRK